MKKINRITFDRLKAQWDILKMRAAYIAAERLIIDEASRGNDLTGADQQFSVEFMSPEQFNDLKKQQPLNTEETLLQKGREVQEQIDKALEDEDYIKVNMLTNVLNGLRLKYNRLKGNN